METESDLGVPGDNNGNMTVDQNGLHYVYDAWNELVQTYDATDTTELEIRYYDAKARMDLYLGNAYQSFYYSVQDQVIELSIGPTYTQYVYGLGYVNDIILRDRNADDMTGTGSLGKTSSGLEERIYVQQDANYNTISLINQTGSTVDKRYVYDPFGGVTILTATWTTSTDGGLYFFNLFQGGLQYGPGGLYTFGARFYSPVLGRWMQQDGGYWDGSDLYQSFRDNPTRYADPTGRMVKVLEVGTDSPPDQAGKQVVQKYVDHVKGDWKKALDELSNADFIDAQRNHRVFFAGKEFTGTKDQFMKLMLREADSGVVDEQKGGLAQAVADLKQLKDQNSQPWDQTVVAAHGVYDDDTGKPTGKVSINDDGELNQKETLTAEKTGQAHLLLLIF